jgi:hypothetical protein
VGQPGQGIHRRFFLVSVSWGAISFLLAGDVYLSWPLFISNLAVALLLAVWFYRRRYHAVLTLDERGLRLERGGRPAAVRWDEVDRVALVHLGGGRMAVRLYFREPGREPLDLPASDLRLNPSDFRFEVMERVRAARKGPEPPGESANINSAN